MSDPLGARQVARRPLVPVVTVTRFARSRRAARSGIRGATEALVGPPSQRAGGHANRRTTFWVAAGCGTTSRRRCHCTSPASPAWQLDRICSGPQREGYRNRGIHFGDLISRAPLAARRLATGTCLTRSLCIVRDRPAVQGRQRGCEGLGHSSDRSRIVRLYESGAND